MEHLSPDCVSAFSDKIPKSKSESISDQNFYTNEVSCFLCATRCSSKAQFLTHFAVHFRNSRRERRKTGTKNVVLTTSTDDDDTMSDEAHVVNHNQADSLKLRQKYRKKRPKLGSANKKPGKVAETNHQPTDPGGLISIFLHISQTTTFISKVIFKPACFHYHLYMYFTTDSFLDCEGSPLGFLFQALAIHFFGLSENLTC